MKKLILIIPFFLSACASFDAEMIQRNFKKDIHTGGVVTYNPESKMRVKEAKEIMHNYCGGDFELVSEKNYKTDTFLSTLIVFYPKEPVRESGFECVNPNNSVAIKK